MSAARKALERILEAVRAYLPPDGIDAKEALSRVIAEVDPWPLKEGESAADMTLRDHFAAKIAAAHFDPQILGIVEHHRGELSATAFIAKAAYEMADAMLKERQQ